MITPSLISRITKDERTRHRDSLVWDVYSVSVIPMPYGTCLATTVFRAKMHSDVFHTEQSIYRTLPNGVTVRERQVTSTGSFKIDKDEVI